MGKVLIREAKAADCQELAKTAWQIQDACNLRAVVNEMDKVLDELSASGCFGDDLQNHPIVIAYVSKLMSLTRIESQNSRGFGWHQDGLGLCLELSEGKDVEYEVIPI